MKAVIFACLAGLALALALPALKHEEYEFVFSKWATQHGKTYATKAERALRLSIFKNNLDYIRKHQTKGASWTLQMNKFGDLSNEEFVAQRNGYRPIKRDHLRSLNTKTLSTKDIPAQINWVDLGHVAAVKDQGQCGSCWAFSAVGSVESINSIVLNKTVVPLSEQQLVDCAGAEGNQGCEGGLMDDAFQYVMDNKGLCTETAYPYTAQDGSCASSKCKDVSTITGFTDVTPNNVNALVTAIAQQPVSVAVDASGSDWQFYSGGVVSDSGCGTSLDHGVIAVGYNNAAATKYYIVRNSWGASWGNAGYIYIAQQDGAGVCGIQMDPSFPTGATKVGAKKTSIRKH